VTLPFQPTEYFNFIGSAKTDDAPHRVPLHLPHRSALD
jgi:hypothetical protein